MTKITNSALADASGNGGDGGKAPKAVRAVAKTLDRLRRGAARTAARGSSSAQALWKLGKSRIVPRIVEARQSASRRGGQGLKLSLEFIRNQAVPWAARTGRWMRKHSRPSVLKRDYRRGLLFIHQALFDRTVERLTFVASDKPTPLSELKVSSLTHISGSVYKPTPRLVFQWAMESLPEQPERFAFVDYGAGRGRVLLLASHLNFDKIIGIESAEQLHNDCEMNIAQYPRSLMKCRDVECILQDTRAFDLPKGPTIFYFCHPFDEQIMSEAIERIARSYDRDPRRLYIVCVDLPDLQVVEKWGIFSPFYLPGLQILKLSLLSPYSVSIFRTAA